jgi:hypothetical protein
VYTNYLHILYISDFWINDNKNEIIVVNILTYIYPIVYEIYTFSNCDLYNNTITAVLNQQLLLLFLSLYINIINYMDMLSYTVCNN